MDAQNEPRSARTPLLNPFGLPTRALVLYHVLLVCLSVFTLDRIAAHLYLPAADSREILLVGSDGCPHSRAVRARLVASGAPFREVSADGQPVSRALASWAFQSFSVPIVVVGPEVIRGNRAERIDAALARLGYGERRE